MIKNNITTRKEEIIFCSTRKVTTPKLKIYVTKYVKQCKNLKDNICGQFYMQWTFSNVLQSERIIKINLNCRKIFFK